MTGYVHNMVEKKQTFSEFALTCARAFGALIELRDEGMDAPIPEQFVPSDYHAKELAKARRELARLNAMTNAQRIHFGQQKRKIAIADYRDALRRTDEENKPLLEMLAKVEAWEPPSSGHEGLKQFMVEQLTTSVSTGDYFREALAKAEKNAPVHYYAEAVTSAEYDVQYHEEELKKEQERVAGRNEWLKKLRESLA